MHGGNVQLLFELSELHGADTRCKVVYVAKPVETQLFSILNDAVGKFTIHARHYHEILLRGAVYIYGGVPVSTGSQSRFLAAVELVGGGTPGEVEAAAEDFLALEIGAGGFHWRVFIFWYLRPTCGGTDSSHASSITPNEQQTLSARIKNKSRKTLSLL